MATRCETCGQVLRGEAVARTPDERARARRERIEATVAARAARDTLLLEHVPQRFTSSHVGYACRRVGRHWSESIGALNRLVRFGFVTFTGWDTSTRQARRIYEKAQK